MKTYTKSEDMRAATLEDRVGNHKIEVGDYIGDLQVDWICDKCNAGNTGLRTRCRRCDESPKFHPNFMYGGEDESIFSRIKSMVFR